MRSLFKLRGDHVEGGDRFFIIREDGDRGISANKAHFDSLIECGSNFLEHH